MMTSNQTVFVIIYEKIAMRAGSDERKIDYEWPYKIQTKLNEAGKFSSQILFVDCKLNAKSLTFWIWAEEF